MTIQILLVEDNEIDREAIRRILDDHYSVTEAVTGNEARELLAGDVSFDLALLDYRLPDVDGKELVAEVMTHDIPIIMLTIEDSPEIIIETLRAGAHDYILKHTYSEQRLKQSIENTLEYRRLQRETTLQQQRLRAQHEQIRQLASELTLAEQRERRRIALILHDNVQQMLHSIQMHVIVLRSELQQLGVDSAEVEAQITEMETLLVETLDATRNLNVELSPPLLLGQSLPHALRWLSTYMKQRHDLAVNLVVGEDLPSIDEDLGVLVFQLVRELLFNVVKHAEIEEATVLLSDSDDMFEICVKDAGVGFDVASLEKLPLDHSGLRDLARRIALIGGRFEISSQSGDGTMANLFVPITTG